jgi:hypothetical protein
VICRILSLLNCPLQGGIWTGVGRGQLRGPGTWKKLTWDWYMPEQRAGCCPQR